MLNSEQNVELFYTPMNNSFQMKIQALFTVFPMKNDLKRAEMLLAASMNLSHGDGHPVSMFCQLCEDSAT
jgi:hypothetical protein